MTSVNIINLQNQNGIEMGDILGIILIAILVVFIMHGIALILSIVSMVINNKRKVNILNFIINILCPIINYEIFKLFKIPIINLLIALFVLLFSIINLIKNIKLRKSKSYQHTNNS